MVGSVSDACAEITLGFGTPARQIIPVTPLRRNGGERTGTSGSRSYDTDVTAVVIVRCVAGWIATDLPNAWEWIVAVLVASFVSVMYWIGRGRRP